MKISLVIPFRDRDFIRLNSVIQSFKKNSLGHDLEIIVSDFGSENPTHEQILQFCNQKQIRHVCSYCEGRPWSRAHAINNGVKASINDWICIVDVDMVLMDPVFDSLEKKLDERTVYFLESYWPKNKSQPGLKGKLNRSYGVFQFIHKKWFEALNGLDERIEFWGGEDNDWVRRLEQSQAKIEWLLGTEFRLIHTWHTTDSTGETRPENAIWKTLNLEIQNITEEVNRNSWGEILKLSDRPVLDAISNKKVFCELVFQSDKMIGKITELNNQLHENKYLKLVLGPRLEKRKLSKFRWLIWQFNDFFKLFSVELKPVINRNFETFLIFRDLVGSQIQDYYISKNFSEIYIISKKNEERI